MRFTIPIALLASASAALPAPATSSGKPSPPASSAILKALAGTYTLLNTSSTLNDEPIPDATYGAAPVGNLIYTASGFMSATITATEKEFRPLVSFPFLANESDADWALVGKHSIGYSGPFRINTALPATETEGQVFHGPLTVANVPTMVGQEHRRNYTIVEREEEGKMVKYLKIGSERGGGFRGVLWWRRLD
ncbi:hypothetical protein COCC4DRAFT_24625 [Bipolaris maydis ATCC 48331]|uniref:Lipocalin-like domain-containing protein n=2 Tax=Cochliobolus heterostrophus TaxID=5016 RepID=M2TK64_COCH5|nr:uncharacterized protein COCC4DRAFT_24625 [Bipolaris maydis ATCC 48331]EMD86864.1 hypothetical protein COCHEDRAFT_1145695 [Bipolaris maydis C5]KAH7559889.1 hypothetical protein BM1_03523 [Bipolaris maydis]ENI04139.1 hypothetical protein COCC4DRAFT_24625 [Bipolaris maydis ATCC 48331]KAJ5021146.1 Lipocalin-like domain-containing protein [Bipolaris maydis]KAJ5055564.1 Lipocalin-like domain-containing protein [Bipolaris maydis]